MYETTVISLKNIININMNKKVVTIEIKNKLKKAKDWKENSYSNAMFSACGLPTRENSKIYTAELLLIKEKITKSELKTYLESGQNNKEGHWHLKIPLPLKEYWSLIKKQYLKDFKIKIVSIDDV